MAVQRKDAKYYSYHVVTEVLIPNLKEIAPKEFKNLIKMTKPSSNQLAGTQSRQQKTVNSKFRDT